MLSREEAWACVAASVRPLGAERIRLAQAVGRTLAEPVIAAVDLPLFDRSAMDGFAVRSADTYGMPLRVVGSVAAGDVPSLVVAPGTAAEISTGAPIPPGADAVLQSELARMEPAGVVPTEPIARGRHVRYRAEDIRRGDPLASACTVVSVQQLAALGSAGVAEVVVHRRARVRIVVNGDEFLEPGERPRPGAVYEVNGLVLRHIVERNGAEVVAATAVGDDPAAVRAEVERGLDGDMLIVTGGMSAGRHDHVREAFVGCGVEEQLWGVRIKPGKPFWFGRRGDTLVFGIPGNPLSSLVCALLFVEPALRRLHGEAPAAARVERARLAVSVAPEDGRTTLLTARLDRAADGGLLATPTFRQGSHMTGALGESDCFVIVPHDAPPMAAGSPVQVLLPWPCEGHPA
jgi:molybdopterin molybdotransferase